MTNDKSKMGNEKYQPEKMKGEDVSASSPFILPFWVFVIPRLRAYSPAADFEARLAFGTFAAAFVALTISAGTPLTSR